MYRLDWRHMLAHMRRKPVAMETIKAYLEQALGTCVVVHLVTDARSSQKTNGRRLLIYDRCTSSRQGLEIQRQGNQPRLLELEELQQFPALVQELDGRCIATVSYTGLHPFHLIVNTQRQQLNGSAVLVLAQTFAVDQENRKTVLPRMARFLLGEERF